MLGREFENVLRERAMQFDDREYQDITETAITVLTAANYEPQNVDEAGDEIGDTVQSHLMLAMLRAPRLEKVLFAAIHDHIKALAEIEGVCSNCGGTRSVPAGGGEDEADVDNGYVRCPECNPAPESGAPRHRADVVLKHRCQTAHPDDPTPCEACAEEDPPMLVCRNCGEAFDTILAAHLHINLPDEEGFMERCEDDFGIMPQSEAM